MLGREEVQRDLLALESGECDAHVCEGFGGPAHAEKVTGEGSDVGLSTTVTHRAEKQRVLECLIMEQLLTATNTFSDDDDRNANINMCNYNGCHEPQQIDYILSSDHSRSRTFDSSATSSDHWGVAATNREKRGKQHWKGHARNPVGWECRDHMGFNNTVRAQLNVGPYGQEPRLSDNPSFALFCPCAGWGFTAMTNRPRLGDKPMVEACGPVQINTGENFYISASRAKNNTAEMPVVIEALFWLNTCVERETLHANNDVLITVDSLYVKGLIEEKFFARESRVLARLLRPMWKVTKERIRLHIRWIRGHSGDVENSIADRLAGAGARQELQHRWWRRTPLSGGWDEEGFSKKVENGHGHGKCCSPCRPSKVRG